MKTTTPRRTLGSVLAGVRIMGQLKQADLAKALNCGEDRISKVENGKSPVRVEFFSDWCRACGADPCDILRTVPV